MSQKALSAQAVPTSVPWVAFQTGIATGAAPQGDLILQLEDLGQRHVARAPLQLPGQPRGAGRALGQGVARPFQPRIGAVVLQDGADDVVQRRRPAQCRHRIQVAPQRAFHRVRGDVAGVEHVVQQEVVGTALARPGLPGQRIQHLLLAGLRDVIVGPAGEQRVGGLQRGAGQPQEQARLARHAVQGPGHAHVGEEADGDLGHGQARAFRDDAMARAYQQPHAPAHDDAVAPAQERLGIGVDGVVQAVLALEEAGDAARRIVAPVVAHFAVHALQVTAGAQRASFAFQHHHRNGRIGGPGVELHRQAFGHLQGQGVQRGLRIERGHAHAIPALGGDFAKPDRRTGTPPLLSGLTHTISPRRQCRDDNSCAEEIRPAGHGTGQEP